MSTRATPSEYASWLAHGSGSLVRALNWKFAWAGREVLPPSLAQTLRELELPELKLYNSYGPAETITCTKAEVRLAENKSASSDDGNPNDADDSRNDSHSSEAAVIPAGFLLPGDSVFIVDHNLDLLPQGAAGQIVIDGPSVAAGYLNDDKLSEKIIHQERTTPLHQPLEIQGSPTQQTTVASSTEQVTWAGYRVTGASFS